MPEVNIYFLKIIYEEWNKRNWWESHHAIGDLQKYSSNQSYILIIHSKGSTSQPSFTSSKLVMETPEQCVESV